MPIAERVKIREFTDAQLVESVCMGDRRAADELYHRHLRPVAGAVTRLLRSHQDVDDILQDSFLSAFERLDTLRNPEKFGPWVTKIAVTKVRRTIRTRKILRKFGLDRTVDDASLHCLVDPRLSQELRADLSMLDQVLERLPTEQRIAWMLRHVEGNSLEDVAYSAGCSLATAKRRIDAAQSRIKAVIELREARHV